MAEINKNYKCSICGNLVKVLQAGIGELVCCGQPMNVVVIEEQTAPSVPETPTEETPTEEPSQEEPVQQ